MLRATTGPGKAARAPPPRGVSRGRLNHQTAARTNRGFERSVDSVRHGGWTGGGRLESPRGPGATPECDKSNSGKPTSSLTCVPPRAVEYTQQGTRLPSSPCTTRQYDRHNTVPSRCPGLGRPAVTPTASSYDDQSSPPQDQYGTFPPRR